MPTEPSNEKNDRTIREQAEAIMQGAGMSPMGEGMASLHEMFESLREGGFTEKQALWILAIGMFGIQSWDPEEDK